MSIKSTVCAHKWAIVKGTRGPEGQPMVMCELCEETRYVKPPKDEGAPKGRRILTEG